MFMSDEWDENFKSVINRFGLFESWWIISVLRIRIIFRWIMIFKLFTKVTKGWSAEKASLTFIYFFELTFIQTSKRRTHSTYFNHNGSEISAIKCSDWLKCLPIVSFVTWVQLYWVHFRSTVIFSKWLL